VVEVSFESSTIVVEEDSFSTSVCVVLLAAENIQREISVQISTEENTAIGTFNYNQIYMVNLSNSFKREDTMLSVSYNYSGKV